MDFFARQSVARRDSRLLVAGFVLAMLATGALVHVAVTGLSVLLGGSPSLAEPGLPALVLIALVWLTVSLGAFFRWLDVRAGAATLARRFGAVPLSDTLVDAQGRALLDVVAEMVIAANVEPPHVHVLRRESNINAFVVGAAGERPALVVSQGALDRLDRDELRGVVAHEIAHLVHGDLPLNMRLLIVLGGLAALEEVGVTLLGEPPDGTARGRSSRPGGSLSRLRAHPAAPVGWLLRALGSVGLIIGTLIRAALSRRREYLADAAAAQFTRQPTALASALVSIRDAAEPRPLHSVHAQELAHLCFHGGATRPWYRRLLASHPPLQSRIDALDRHIDVKRRKRVVASRRPRAASGGEGLRTVASEPFPTGEGAGVDAAAADIGTSAVSDRILLMLPDGVSCLAALCALFAGSDPIARRDYLGALAFAFDRTLAVRVERLLTQIAAELEGDRLALIEHASGVLRATVKIENRRRLMLKLERTLAALGRLDLAAYATLQLVRRKLDVEFPLVETLASRDGSAASAEGRRVKSFEAMGEELALLLSLMVESSGAPDEVLDREFARVLRCYTRVSLPRRHGSEPGIVADMERAFQVLYVQPQPVRRAFVQHCIEIMQADGHCARAERSLLELFAASLGCEGMAARECVWRAG